MDLTVLNILTNNLGTIDLEVKVLEALEKRVQLESAGVPANLQAKAADAAKNMKAVAADLHEIWDGYVAPNL